MDQERLELLARVASWYYEDNLLQSDIARRIGRSRSMVSRLLQEAREQGLVEIKICYPLVKTVTELERALCETFHLTRASVLANPPSHYPLLIRHLGDLGAQLLRHYLHDEVRVGTMWGTTIYEVLWALPTLSYPNSTVIQMIGTVGRGNRLMDGPELVRALTEKLGGTCYYLPAPILAEDEAVARSFLRQSTIADVLEQARQVDVALLGIGVLGDYFSYLETTGYVDASDLARLEEAGGVGSTMALVIDERGEPLDVSINRRVIGFKDMEALREIPTVIAVAGGVRKAPAILAALRGGYLDVLVTDAATAATMLRLHRGGNGKRAPQEWEASVGEIGPRVEPV
jgi:DNA-binding transcriptional regulator LsrR (DeoR family)